MSAGLSTPTTEASPDGAAAVLNQVRELVMEVIGEDYLLDVEIGMETTFEEDLELESIEFVALAEQLQEHYPEIDFVEWVAGMEVDEIMHLRVGQLVEFIAQCRS